MRRFTLIFALISYFCSWQCLAQDTSDGISCTQNGVMKNIEPYSPIDSVPNWVMQKVTPKEYQLWQNLSHFFYVDHSVLHEEMSQESKDKLYADIENTCKAIKCGVYKGDLHSFYSFSLSQNIDTTIPWTVCELIRIDANIQYCKRKAIVYQGRYSKDASVTFTVWYVSDALKKTTSIIKYKLSAIGDKFVDFKGIGNITYQQEQNILQGSCGGTLFYTDNQGNKFNEDFNMAFSFIVDDISVH